MKQFLITVLLFIMTTTVTHAQEFSCGIDQVEHYLRTNHPGYDQEKSLIEQGIYEKVNGSTSRITGSECQDVPDVVTIPVVVHIIHLGEPVGTGTNISDAQIVDAVLGLNERFRKITGDGVDTEIQFELAVRDPQGNPTTGINRVNGAGVPKYATNGIAKFDTIGANQFAIKDLSIWPRADYLNIWVVKYIATGGGAYAYYPTYNQYEGVVIQYDVFKKNNKSLTHEIGHSLYLIHTFEGINQNGCIKNDNCSVDGDKICDTPPHLVDECSTICGSGIIENSTQNYLSYCPSSVTTRFTNGQKDRMRATLMDPVRWSLVVSPGLIPATTPLEVSIDSIDFLENTTQPLCDGGLTVSVKLENIGVNTINSVKLRLFLNDIDMGSSTINPSTFRGGQSQWVGLPSIIIPESGNYSVRAEIEKVNNQVDYSILNNTVCTSVDLLVDQVVITTAVNPVNSGTASGGKTMTCDGDVELVAVSAPGYSFKNWTENGIALGTDSTMMLNVSMTDTDRNIVANFKQNIPSAVKTAETTIGNLFPNPATDVVIIQLVVKKPTMITLNIVDLLGRVFDIRILQVSGEVQTTIDVGSYPKGCYLIKITDNQGVATRTFLVQ